VCVENAEEFLQSKFGNEVMYEVICGLTSFVGFSPVVKMF